MMRFTEDMKIGIPHIDSQHKGLIDFANKASSLCVANPSREEMEECLDFLGDYVVKHFSDEEKLQIESKYPRYRQHKEIHQEFVGTFASLYAEFQKNGPSAELSSALTDRVLNWIMTHIKMEDVAFGKHYTKVKLDRLQTHFRSRQDYAE